MVNPNFGQSEQKSEALLNAGMAKLLRIDKLRLNSANCVLLNDFHGWYVCLTRIRVEIHERMTIQEREQADQLQAECRYFSVEQYNVAKRKKDIYNYNENALFQYDLFLADLEFKYGMSLPDKPDQAAGMVI